MALDEMIEQLSFGRTLPRLETCLGLFVSPEAMFLSEVKLDGNRPQTVHLVPLPVPGGEASSVSKTRTVGTLNTEFLGEQDKLLAIMKKALEGTHWNSKHIMVTLSHHFGLLRYFAMPAIDRRFWKTAVPAEAKKYVPIPFGSLSHDYQIRQIGPGPDRKPRMGALFGVTHMQNITNLRSIVDKLGLTLIGTELAPGSVERVWDCLGGDPTHQPYAQVHFDGGHVRILISEGGLPIFFREVVLSADATVMDRRKVDLNGCIDFTRKQIGSAGPSSIRLSGNIGDMAAWRDAFTQDLGREVSFVDVDKALGLRGGKWGGYAAIGAGMRALVPTSISLDLGGMGRITDEDRRVATAILILSTILAAVLLVVGVFRYVSAEFKARQLKTLKSDTETFETFRGKTAAEIEGEIVNMRNQVNSLGAVAQPQVPLTRLMEAITEVIPRSAWITDIIYDNPLATGARQQARKLTINGKVSDRSRAIEQDVAYKFGEKLRLDQRFEKGLKACNQPEVKFSERQGGGEAVGSSEALGAKELNATTFSITCRSEKEKSN